MRAELQAKLKEFMKARDQVALDAMRGLMTAIQYEEISKKVEPLPADAIVATIQREVKKLKEEREFLVQANRNDDLAKLDRQIQVLENLLPQQLSTQQLEMIITGFKAAQ